MFIFFSSIAVSEKHKKNELYVCMYVCMYIYVYIYERVWVKKAWLHNNALDLIICSTDIH